jgi:hypothetical protein
LRQQCLCHIAIRNPNHFAIAVVVSRDHVWDVYDFSAFIE